MNIHEIEALQNAVNSAKTEGLEIYEYIFNDKRKTTKHFYLTLNGATISPRLDYENMNHFILGFKTAKKFITLKQQATL